MIDRFLEKHLGKKGTDRTYILFGVIFYSFCFYLSIGDWEAFASVVLMIMFIIFSVYANREGFWDDEVTISF